MIISLLLLEYNKLIRFRYSVSVNTSDSPCKIVWSVTNLAAFIDWEINNITKGDNGAEYQINITNRFGETSTITHFNVTCNFRLVRMTVGNFQSFKVFLFTDAPSFILPVLNQTVKKGSSVTLEANIDGNPLPDVHIQSSNFRQRLYIINNEEFLYQYNLSNVQLNQSTSYTFSATSEPYGTNISQTCFLTVLGKQSLFLINLKTHYQFNF
jgi:hypothetical protein